VRYGAASQNRDQHPDFAAHLLGRVAWVGFVHPGKEAKLREIYERIDWGEAVPMIG
jgi:RNA-directed DNA polymerase